MQSVQVTLSKSITVRSLLIKGALFVKPADAPILVDAAFVIASGSGSRLKVNGTDFQRTVTFHLRRNPEAYKDIPPGSDEDSMLSGGRVLAGEKA